MWENDSIFDLVSFYPLLICSCEITSEYHYGNTIIMSNSIVNLRKPFSLRKIDSEEDMKEYAETAMNELLGWYGYDKLNKVDSQALNLCLFPSESTQSTKPPAKRSTNANKVSLYQPSESLSSLFSSSSVSSDEATAYLNSKIEKNDPMESTLQATKKNVSIFSAEVLHCACCNKDGLVKNSSQRLTIGDQTFCSEQCLNQFRRTPKRNKTCDWCRHVRHSVTYVDLQDGDRQYQFCSDKCLNQFKLDIFCQETKEHLEIHPYHHEQLDDIRNSPLSSSSLITPDLWLRNCVSPSSSDQSRSSPPAHTFAFSSNAEITLTKTSVPEEKAATGDCYSGIESKKRKMQSSCDFNVFNAGNDVVRPKVLQGGNDERAPVSSCSLLQPCASATLTPAQKPDEQRRLRRYRQRQRQHRHLDESPSIARFPLSRTNAGTREYSIQSVANSTPVRSSSNLQIPPLLPISKSLRSFQDAKDSQSSFNEPPNVSTKTSSPSETGSAFLKTVLPPATILVPYPVLIPIPIPIPIPLPIPIPVPANKSDRSQKGGNLDCDGRTSADVSFSDKEEHPNDDNSEVLEKESQPHPRRNNISRSTYCSSDNDISVSTMSSRNMFTKKKEKKKKTNIDASFS